jgi:hypothetical protein
VIDIETLIELSNPLRDDVLPTAESPEAQQLFLEITAGSTPWSPNATRPRWVGPTAGTPGAHSHRWRAVAALALAAIVVGVGASALSGVTNPGPMGGSAAPAPSWKLVGAISQATWSESPAAGYMPGEDLTCPTATTCYVEVPRGRAGPWQVEVSTDGGSAWHQSTLPRGVAPWPTTLSCMGASTCVALGQDAAGNVLIKTVDSGETWTSVPVAAQLPSGFQPQAVSCTSATSCVAIFVSDSTVGVAVLTTDGGTTWSRSTLPAPMAPIDVHCFTDGTCIITGRGGSESAQGMGLYSTNGGATWAQATMPTGVGMVASLSCDSAINCLAVTTTAVLGPSRNVVTATTNGGKTWVLTGDNGLPPGAEPFAVACASSAFCWAAGSVSPADDAPQLAGTQPSLLAMSTDGGHTWRVSQLPEALATGTVVAVSCPGPTRCYAMEDLPNNASSAPVLLSYRG